MDCNSLNAAEKRAKNAKNHHRWVANLSPEKRAELRTKERANYKKRKPWVKRRQDENKQLRLRPETWGKSTLYGIKSRCKKEGIPFNITFADLIVPEVCPILKKPFVFGGGLREALGPSVDRLVPELGYVKGNIQIISYYANRLKCDCTDPAVFRAIADYIEAR